MSTSQNRTVKDPISEEVLKVRTTYIFGFCVYLCLYLKWSHREKIKALLFLFAFDLSPAAMSPFRSLEVISEGGWRRLLNSGAAETPVLKG